MVCRFPVQAGGAGAERLPHRDVRRDDDGERSSDARSGAHACASQWEVAQERDVGGEWEERGGKGDMPEERGRGLAIGEAGEEFGGEASCEHTRSLRVKASRTVTAPLRVVPFERSSREGLDRCARRVLDRARTKLASRVRPHPQLWASVCGEVADSPSPAARGVGSVRSFLPSLPTIAMPSSRPGIASLFQGLVSRLFVYYAVLAGAAWASWSLLSETSRANVLEALAPILGMGGGSHPVESGEKLTNAVAQATSLPPQLVALLVAVSCVGAFLLALPIAWTYMFTRQKKGYSQSVVHTLVLLPVVVAAVAVLVRNSIALAFSLAGILAAVRFRTSLEDSKDAVYIFVVSALGLACGVQLEVALVLSLLYIGIALALWQTDFARTPPALEGKRAQQHMQRAVAIANRTSQFVARLDREILETLAPEQLDALADRVRRRRGDVPVAGADSTEDRPRFDGRITVVLAGTDDARPTVDGILAARAKRYELVSCTSVNDETTLVYAVRARKSERLEQIARQVQDEGMPHVARASAEQWT